MCTYQTTTLAVEGSGKGADGWFPVTDATVYFDHPVHARRRPHAQHRPAQSGAGTRCPGGGGAGCRTSARALAEAILETLATVPAGLRRLSNPA